jgi:hypothetical protein
VPQRLAFCGASGTGKTVLTTWINEVYGLTINPVGSRSVFKEMGFTSAYESDAAGKRSEFQTRLLRQKTEWEADHESFVTDRTTFDNLAYSMLHDAHMVDEAMFRRSCEGMSRYQCVVYCPVSVFINTDGDPTRVPDLTYHQLFDATLWGLLQKIRPSETRLVTLPFPALHNRKEFLASLMK